MTKDEAIDAMHNGQKVTHRFFSPDEEIHMIDEVIYDENGYKMAFDDIDFWTDRQGEEWQDGWEIF